MTTSLQPRNASKSKGYLKIDQLNCQDIYQCDKSRSTKQPSRCVQLIKKANKQENYSTKYYPITQTCASSEITFNYLIC